jgi:hypothetical protein
MCVDKNKKLKMAIATEFINFIVPIQVIRDKYPGGWEQCLQDHQHLIGGRVWYDQYLFRDGAMGGADIEDIVARWEAMDFEGIVTKDNQRYWQDMCVFTLGWVTLVCDWIDFDETSRGAFLKGTKPGELAGISSKDRKLT